MFVAIAALLPLLIVTAPTLMTLSGMKGDVINSVYTTGSEAEKIASFMTNEYLMKSGESTVLLLAQENALWVRNYLLSKNITTIQELVNDSVLQELGKHRWYGKEYVWIAGVYGDGDWRLLIHPLGEEVFAKRVVEDLHWDEKYPEVIPILRNSALGGTATVSCGYYTWGEVYGTPARKYLCNVPVNYVLIDENTGKKIPLSVGTGAYLDGYFKDITESEELPGVTVSQEISQKLSDTVNSVVEKMSSSIYNIQLFALISVIAAILVAGIVMLVVTSLISRPITEIAESADKISEGDLETRIPYQDRDDEIGILAKSIERLRRSLQAAAESLEGAFRCLPCQSPTQFFLKS